MRDFLRFMLIEPFTENDMGWVWYILGVIMWIIVVGSVVGLAWLFVWLADSSFLPIKEKDGIIVNKYIVPAHTTTSYYYVNKMMLPTTQYYPTAYEVVIRVDSLTDDLSIPQDFWTVLETSQRVHCHYTNGRILNSLYIKSFKTSKSD